MSASMVEGVAAILAEHYEVRIFGPRCRCGKQLASVAGSLAAHQAEQLAANGYGRLEEAWDEGFSSGWAEARDPGPFVNDIWDAETPNPHRRRPE